MTRRFYSQGEQIGGVSYYFFCDHLGSIRGVTDSSGAVQARYKYALYGKRTKLIGSIDSDFGFTGHYQHVASGLTLAPYRAYDADVGRWISRDLIAFDNGLNLYSYVSNAPINLWDILGLIEGSPNNIIRRKSINNFAKDYDGSTDWVKDKRKDDFPPGTWKCNKFVCDVVRKANASAKVDGRCPQAGDWADPDTKIQNWRVLKEGENPEPGDIGAYKLGGGGADYSGHTGVHTDIGDISAHEHQVGPPDTQFISNDDTIYRRYTGE